MSSRTEKILSLKLYSFVEDTGQYITIYPQGYTYPTTTIIYDYLSTLPSVTCNRRKEITKDKLVPYASIKIRERINKFTPKWEPALTVFITLNTQVFNALKDDIPTEFNHVVKEMEEKCWKKTKTWTSIYTGYIPAQIGRMLTKSDKIDLDNIWVSYIKPKAPTKYKKRTDTTPWLNLKHFKNICIVIPYKTTFLNGDNLITKNQKEYSALLQTGDILL